MLEKLLPPGPRNLTEGDGDLAGLHGQPPPQPFRDAAGGGRPADEPTEGRGPGDEADGNRACPTAAKHGEERRGARSERICDNSHEVPGAVDRKTVDGG